MSKIINAASIPLFAKSGAVPNVSGAMRSYYQQMTFVPVEKTISGFQVIENAEPIDLIGVIQPFTPRQLLLKPEGQRAWTWFTLHAEPSVVLQVDSCIEYLGKQYRIMSRANFSIYGYVVYEMVQDWTGAGP